MPVRRDAHDPHRLHAAHDDREVRVRAMSTEPVVALVLTQITAAVGLLIAFGVHITQAQGAAVGAFAVATLGLAGYVRSKVTPVKKLPPG